MTHTPTLPNGFSRDFSEAREGERILIWHRLPGGSVWAVAGSIHGDRVWAEDDSFPLSWALCWCPIPTPGDAVLNELAGRGN